ncbi:MAG: hypothetical protein C0502_05945 [Opitutus sp.]|nr:hypothetical protein [Opitutus sp.]
MADSAPVPYPETLGDQANDAWNKLVSSLLAAQKGQTDLCTGRYEQLLAALRVAATPAAPNDCNIFATSPGRYVVLRGVGKTAGLTPVNPAPLAFADAIAWVNQNTAAILPTSHDAPLRRSYDPFEPPRKHRHEPPHHHRRQRHPHASAAAQA